ncbi:hybrid sensor histidine kinase/response regulator transcription factor [Bacteroides mediterraneensis]|uniref:hybrid sensor histidine kinase/response regulator transcription factor n=1 Tax=Bacteroides mediterraneensis TaxID=1841856 RepID=UPI000932A783|nr:hybrid sensor histidine kinase/response regulator transcription factor [Bacteroides mediterraneensis]
MKNYTLILLLLLGLAFPSKAQRLLEKDFQVLNMNDGIADNDIHSIEKDTEGFIWFGTSSGLSRYDGQDFKTFRITEALHRTVGKVVSLNKDYLLVRSERTLFLFDKRRERFLSLWDAERNRIVDFTRFVSTSDGHCWGVAGNTLSEMDLSTASFREDTAFVYLQSTVKVESESELMMLCLGEDGKSLYGIGRKGTVYRYDRGQKRLETLCVRPMQRDVLVTSALQGDNFLWITTLGDGLYGYDLTTCAVHHWNYDPANRNEQLSHNDVFQLLPLGDSRYMALTWNGYTMLTLTPERELKMQAFHSFGNSGNQYIETRMVTGYYDPEGLLWIGTEGGGVLFSDLRQLFYQQYAQAHSNELCGIQMDKEGYLWLATFHKGLLRSTQPFDGIQPLDFQPMAPGVAAIHTVLCSAADTRGGLWFGSRNGSVLRYGEDGSWQALGLDEETSPEVWSLLPFSENEAWAGTSNGLYRVNLRKGTSVKVEWNNPQIPDHIQVRALALSDARTLWLGTTRGLLRLSMEGNRVVRSYAGYEREADLSPTDVEVRALLFGSDQVLWVGYAGNGLGACSPVDNRILFHYTTEEGLCSNFVTALAEDGDHSLWVGSNSGISRLSRHLQSFYNFYISGSNRSVFFGKDFLFWGNHSTLTYFRPSRLRFHYPIEKGRVVFTNLEVNHASVQIGEYVNGQVVLPRSLLYTTSLHLNHANRNFSLSFSNLLYLHKLQKYLYRLYPYQEEWIMADEGDKISYDRLPAGEYTFQVKTVFQDQSEGEVSSLAIVVDPHWSETWWFRLLVAVGLISMVLVYLHRVRLKEKRVQYELRLEHELFTVNMERNKEIELRKEREDFFTMAAHELRTPLTLILAPLRELLHKTPTSHPFYAKLSMMFKYAEGLHTLTDRLLYIQKAEAGMVKLRLSQVDVEALLVDVAQGFQSLAAERKIDYAWELAPDCVPVWADREKLSSVVQNLISNAFKYTPEGGKIRLKVERKEIDGKHFCCLSVSDTGKGIDAVLLQHIFDPFVTGKEAPAVSTHVGIGLKIVKHIVEMHHGRVTVDSEPGKGSLFCVYLPEGKSHFNEDDCTWEEATAVSHETAPVSPELILPVDSERTEEEGEKQTAARQTVLVIEDNTDMRRYLCELLRKQYRVLEAENGEEGLETAVEQVPDLVLSDVMMPVMDGFTCCAELRKRKETAHIPVLMLTAKAEDRDSVEASRRGADDYLRKPFNPEVLLAKIACLLDMRRRLKQIYTRTLLHASSAASASTEKPESVESEFMQKVWACIEANVSNPDFNVKVLSGELHMSLATLYRKLKQHTDLSAVELIRHIRMTKAALLLMETSLSVTEVAERVGFNDLPTFRKHFTDMFGVSPSKYAESGQGGNNKSQPEAGTGV